MGDWLHQLRQQLCDAQYAYAGCGVQCGAGLAHQQGADQQSWTAWTWCWMRIKYQWSGTCSTACAAVVTLLLSHLCGNMGSTQPMCTLPVKLHSCLPHIVSPGPLSHQVLGPARSLAAAPPSVLLSSR